MAGRPKSGGNFDHVGASDLVKIAPSILSLNPLTMLDGIRQAEEGGADLFHVDVIDGVFAPNISFGPSLVRALYKETTVPMDVHMMITNPMRYLETFCGAGAKMISVHLETLDKWSCAHYVRMAKELGFEAGVAIKPYTKIPAWLREFYGDLSYIVPMSVEPGFSGQSFLSDTLGKIQALNDDRRLGKYNFLIEADGGVNSSNVKLLMSRGVDVLVTGSAVFDAPNIKEAIRELKKLAEHQA
ncbi:MAG: ribulose-phosphate 3-epimerase [Candidatus Marsarchaeota archaeon]|nr:ribulose-phosphate 3-epimerase [Candidatus Marsarchaeota archaeon]